MKLRLSYFGWMVTRHLVDSGQLHLGVSPRDDLLLDLWTGALATAGQNKAEGELLAEGLVELVDDVTSFDQTRLRYRRNPFEHLTKIIFEFTTLCNFNCAHCYNTRVPRLREKPSRNCLSRRLIPFSKWASGVLISSAAKFRVMGMAGWM